jgi:hypothetical protein
MSGEFLRSKDAARVFIQVCPICYHACKARNFWRSLAALKMHIKAKHNIDIDYFIAECPECGYKVFGGYEYALRELRLHILRTHLRSYI